MTREQILEIIERYKLRIPPTAYYDLKVDIVNCSEILTGSTTKSDLGVDAVSRKAVINQIFYSTDNSGDVVLGSALRERIARLPSVTPQLSTELENASPIIDWNNCHTSEQLDSIATTKNDLGVDCISRIETIDYLCKHCPDDGECFKDCDEIKHLRQMPSVTPQEPRWIPVSEMLPEKNMRCLVAVGRFNFTEIATYSDLMGIIDHKIFYQGDVGHDNFKNITQYVKAWMPLPKEYEPQESEG